MKSRGGLALALLLALASLAVAASGVMSVQVKNGQLLDRPSFLGRLVATLGHGDQVQVIRDQSPWFQVADAQGRQGWMHLSTLTDKAVTLRPGGRTTQTGASGEEMALAGKGFSSEVETAYRGRHREANYAWVDRMERDFRPRPEELAAFLQQGGIPTGGGR